MVRIMPPRGPRNVLCVVVACNMRMREWAGVDATGNQTCNMSHINHEIGTDHVRNRTEAREVKFARTTPTRPR